jgi:hypothetical protein
MSPPPVNTLAWLEVASIGAYYRKEKHQEETARSGKSRKNSQPGDVKKNSRARNSKTVIPVSYPGE